MTQANKEVANKLFEAFNTHTPIPFISNDYQLSEEEAYLTQDELIYQLQQVNDATIAGYKVSMTSAKTQAIANTNEPAYGTILSNKIVHSSATVPLSKLFAPLLEPEIMFILTNDLPKDADIETIAQYSKIAAGIEVPDARYENWFPNFTLGDLIADNTATGLIVVSEETTQPKVEALSQVSLKLYKDSEQIATGESTEVLGNPLNAVKWLNDKLNAQGKTLTKGQVISSGTFISPLPLEKGEYKAVYSNLGEVTFTVTE